MVGSETTEANFMEHSYEELKHKTVQQLREIAAELDHEAVQGATQMNKEHLVPAVCKALGIEAHEHHVAVGIDKAGIKARLKALKGDRDKALEAHDHKALKKVRRQIHKLKHDLRSHAT
jgi:DNA-binding IclR family transcriptional regulator